MIRYFSLTIIALFCLVSCSSPTATAPNVTETANSTEKGDINFKTPEEVTARLEEQAYRKSIEFIINYTTPDERIYMQKHRVTHFKMPEGEKPIPVRQRHLINPDKIDDFKKQVRASGFLDLRIPKEESDRNRLELKLDGLPGGILLKDIPNSPIKKQIEDLIKSLYTLSSNPD